MELAVVIGMSITEFWEICPYELSIALKAYSKRKEIEADEYQIKSKHLQNMLTIHAYQNSAWVWKHPSKDELMEMLGDKQKQKEMTPEEMLEKVKILNQMFGGEIIYGTEK